ncbi:Mitogen-activated protein (MAP) kinase, conserved site-containing protein [Artemisia annua]|uniref:Mitogen-activated protein kinase n=1 Tax=Artemisia annua TaxID=35608 RepID=A0A2U1PF80_ARTAN|nr:Mitogen-activated protein (MAP) kinase, conserved site-containing protein [Artemisia annua]
MFPPISDDKESESSSILQCPQPCRHFKFSEIKIATRNFDESLVIGHGGFGKVYKGTIVNGPSLVLAAIKRLDSTSDQGAHEFRVEVETLSKLRHCHLVSLIGYCDDRKEMILVYEYMLHGSLEDHLHKLSTPLTWLQRLKICIGAARGLDYLHTGTGIEFGIIHRDVKSSNILLHESWAAKISDFGLSKIGPKDQLSTHVTTLVKGTFGYLDPDYFQTGRLTRKSDVYAFGVLLFEVVCRKRAVDASLGDQEYRGLARWAQDSIIEGNLKHIIDSDIRDQIYSKCLKEFARIADRCLHSHPKQRPKMAEVVVGLESVLAVQEKMNSSLQPGSRSIFGRVADMFPFANSGENSVWVDKNALNPATPCGISMAVKKSTEESFQGHSEWQGSREVDCFTKYDEWSRYKIKEVIGTGSSGVVCSAFDTLLGKKVAIKKINNIFEHVFVAVRILREIHLLRVLRHPDIVEIQHILLPPSRREFNDIYVVFELMESDLHQVIKANDNLTPEHCRFFLYQLLRGLKYIHSANVFHRDLKPRNILVNADCKLKICDFGLARVVFNDTPTAICWTDYVATRWYRAPELCGSFFSKYTQAIDIWSIGCIFAEILTGKPLFPGKSLLHQLDLMTDLLGTPSLEAIDRIQHEKPRKYLCSMKKKKPISFSKKFPNADPLALRLLERMLAFEAKDRPTVEEALSDPYFKNLAKAERETCAQPFSKREFEFEKRGITKEDIRERIYREILEYHPSMLKDFLYGNEPTGLMYPSAVDKFKKQFSHLEEHHGKSKAAPPLERRHTLSSPRASILYSKETAQTAIEAKNGHSRRSIKEAGSGCMTSGENGGTVASRDAQKNRILRIRSGSSAPVVRVSPSDLVPRKTGHFPDRYFGSQY